MGVGGLTTLVEDLGLWRTTTFTQRPRGAGAGAARTLVVDGNGLLRLLSFDLPRGGGRLRAEEEGLERRDVHLQRGLIL